MIDQRLALQEQNAQEPLILVAGGLGYIGSHVVIALLKSHYRVAIVDDLSNSKVEKLAEIQRVMELENIYKSNSPSFYQIDLTDKSATLKLFEQSRPSVVIAMAGLKSVPESTERPIDYYATNFGIITNILQAMEICGCRNLIFSSSATVYNPQTTLPFSENSETGVNLNHPYAMTKYMIETFLEDICQHKSNININSLRYFNPVGNHPSGLLSDNPRKPLNLFPVITRSIIENKPFQIFGTEYQTKDKTAERDYIHVEDVASAHVVTLKSMIRKNGVVEEHSSDAGECDSRRYCVYNVGLGYPMSVLEIVQAYERVNLVKLNYQFAPERPGDAPVSYSDPSKIKALGWSPRWSLDDCVKHCYSSLSFISSNRQK